MDEMCKQCGKLMLNSRRIADEIEKITSVGYEGNWFDRIKTNEQVAIGFVLGLVNERSHRLAERISAGCRCAFAEKDAEEAAETAAMVAAYQARKAEEAAQRKAEATT